MFPLDALEADLPVELHEVVVWQTVALATAELRGGGLQQGQSDTAALVMGVYAHASQNRRPMFRHEPEQAQYRVVLTQREQDGSGRLDGATVVPVSIETPHPLEVRGNGSPDSTHASLLPNGSRISCGKSPDTAIIAINACLQRRCRGYSETPQLPACAFRAVNGHEQRTAVGGVDLAHGVEAGLLIAPDGAPVPRRRIGLHPGDSGIGE